MPGKLGRPSKERNALLRGLASQLLWYGKIETTAAKAKQLRPYVEKLITKAVNTYDDNIEFEVTKKDSKGKEITVTMDGALYIGLRLPNQCLDLVDQGCSLPDGGDHLLFGIFIQDQSEFHNHHLLAGIYSIAQKRKKGGKYRLMVIFTPYVATLASPAPNQVA